MILLKVTATFDVVYILPTVSKVAAFTENYFGHIKTRPTITFGVSQSHFAGVKRLCNTKHTNAKVEVANITCQQIKMEMTVPLRPASKRPSDTDLQTIRR